METDLTDLSDSCRLLFERLISEKSDKSVSLIPFSINHKEICLDEKFTELTPTQKDKANICVSGYRPCSFVNPINTIFVLPCLS